MKSIVIYNSQTGFTKKYAEWISEATGCESVEFKKASKMNLFEYDALVFGSWCKAGHIQNVKWFKNIMPELAEAGKKLFVYFVGASPAESPEVPVTKDINFTKAQQEIVKLFYCPGGINYDNMGFGSKLAMKLLIKGMKAKKNPTENDLRIINTLSQNYDITDKKYVEEIIAEIK